MLALPRVIEGIAAAVLLMSSLLTASFASPAVAQASSVAPSAGGAPAEVAVAGSVGSTPGRNGRLLFLQWDPPDAVDTRQDIYTMRRDGTGQRRLTSSRRNGEARWAPFGHRVLFVVWTPRRGGDIWVMNADGTGKRRVLGSRANDQEATWAPGGQRFAFARTARGGAERVWVYSFKTDTARAVTPAHGFHAYVEQPAWSPDGKRIVFVATSDDLNNRSDMYLVRPDGTGLEQLTFTPYQFEFQPDWAPSGGRLVFNRGKLESTCFPVFTMRADGTGLERVKVGCHTSHVQWSPNGRKFVGYRAGHRQPGIWVMSIDGSARRFVAPGHSPDWQRRP